MPFSATITKEETTALPVIAFEGPIAVIEREEEVEEACRELLAQPAIGFDTETRPSFRPGPMNRVALLQLSTPERCYLFRLCRIPLNRAIRRVLESPDVLKVGAAVDGDLAALREIAHGFRPHGFVDLQQMAARWGIEEKSLRKLSAIVLGHRISKAQRLSNWAAAELTAKQQRYAATDAWVSLRIYHVLGQTPSPDA